MSVGVIVPLPAYTLNPAFIAKKAEDLGFESIWYHEHPVLPVKSESAFPATGGEIPWTYAHFSEPYISLAMAAAVTTKIKLATGITLVPERNPRYSPKRSRFSTYIAAAVSSSGSAPAGTGKRRR
jgi:hypothetical protein